jgi:hypothetical protein
MAAYLATFLAWPFYDQMTRFLLPVVPVLVLYAFFVAALAVRAVGRRAIFAHAVVAVLIASLAVPALGFMHQRSRAEGRVAEMTDWYRRPDLDDARRRAGVHLDLLADMETIRTLTRPDARVMWVVPGYIALLAQRHGVPAPRAHLGPQAYRDAITQARPDYVFLSVYHPRDTTRDAAWRAGMQALSGVGDVVHVRHNADGAVSSALIALRREELEKWRARPST